MSQEKEKHRAKSDPRFSFKKDIDQSDQALGWKTLMDVMREKASSLEAKERIQHLKAFSKSKEAEAHSFNVEEASRLLKTYQEEEGEEGFDRPHMKSLDSYSSWKEKLDRKTSLSTHEFKRLGAFLRDCLDLKGFLNFAGRGDFSDDLSFLKLKSKIIKASPLLEALSQVVTEEGEIRVSASPLLSRLYREKKEKIDTIQRALDQFVKDHSLKALLQDRYVTTREGRWVLPIKSGMREHFDGIIHAMSQSHQTVFMEPLVVMELNNQIHQVDLKIKKEVNRLLLRLSQFFFSLSEELEKSKKVLLTFDVLFAQALWALEFKGISFRFKNFFHLVNLKHPFLEREKNKNRNKAAAQSKEARDVVPNDVEFNKEKRILLLSGPNAGGKTVFLKAIGLASQMARFGLPICAEKGSVLPFFEDLHVLIGDLQEVEKHRSQFSSHLRVLNQFTEVKGLKQLLLIDEICSSTDSEEGVALAKSFIQNYSVQNVYAVVTSHLRKLSFDWPKSSGVQVGSFEYCPKSGPTYKFLSGVVGRSHALDLAESMNVSPAIIDRAKSFLSPKEVAYLNQIKEARDANKELQDLKKTWKREIEKVEEKKKKYTELMQAFKKEKDRRLNQVLKKTESKIEDLLEGLKSKDMSYQKTWLKRFRASLPELVKVARKKENQAPKSLEEFSRLFSPGELVFLPSLNKQAVLQSKPNHKGEVMVLSQSMRLNLSWKEVKALPSKDNETQSSTPLSKYFPLGESSSPSFSFSSSKMTFTDQKIKKSTQSKKTSFKNRKRKSVRG